MGWWHLTWKDLRLQFRDRRSLAVLLLLPLIFISIIGLSTGKMLGWRADNQVIKVAWIDRDGGELAQRIRTQLDERSEVQVIAYTDSAVAKHAVFSGEITLLMTIGPEFQKRVDELQLRDFFARKKGKGRLAGGLSRLDISVDTKASWNWISNMVSDSLLSLTLEDVFPEVAKKHNLGRALIHNMEVAAAEDDAASAGADESRIAQAPSIAAGRKSSGALYDRLVPGYTVMFAFFLVNVMARSFIAERELGTLRRLRLTPLTPLNLLIGKTLPYFVISLVQSLALFVFGWMLFDMSWGERPWLLAPIIVCTSIAATSLSLLVATSVRTDAQVSSYSNLIVISLAGIGGCFVPREWMPDVMRHISLITPHAWSLNAYLEALTNPQPDLSVIVKSCLLLLGFSTVFFVTGCVRFRGLR